MGDLIMKYLSLVLVFLLVATAAGRFYAEAQVRQSAKEIARLEREAAYMTANIESVRLDVEVLESAGRLSKLNASHLALGTVRAEQLLDDRGFAEIIGLPTETKVESPLPEGVDIIGNAIGMSDPALTPGVYAE